MLLNTVLACAAIFVILYAIHTQEATTATRIPLVSQALRWYSWGKHILPTRGIIPVIITGRSSGIVAFRAKELGIDELYQGVSDKEAVMRQVAQKYSASLDEIAYIGDDVNDLACMKLCGLAACPQDAVEKVREHVDLITSKPGGHGAVRELIDFLSNH